MLDLSQDGGQAADLAAIATWPNPADDYDLVLATPQGFGGSQAAQPAAPSFEAAEARGLRHCDLLHVDVLTRNAVSPGAVQLQLAVTPLAPGEPAPSGPGSPAGPSPATPTGSGPPAPRATRRRPKLSVRRIRRARGRYSVALRATARLTRIRTSVFRVRKGGRRVLVGRRALRRPLGPRSRRVRLPLARPAGGAPTSSWCAGPPARRPCAGGPASVCPPGSDPGAVASEGRQVLVDDADRGGAFTDR